MWGVHLCFVCLCDHCREIHIKQGIRDCASLAGIQLNLEQILLPKALPESALHNSRQHLSQNNYIFSRCSESLEKSLLDV